MHPAGSEPDVGRDAGAISVLDLLTLEALDRDLFRATTVFDDRYPLYGGQVVAQALLAAGRTVAEDRLPHSLHGYYLRSGDAAQPTIFRVDRDRDGRSYSARQVVAVQNGEVIFTMSASFQVPETGLDRQVDPLPEAAHPTRRPSSRFHDCSRCRDGCPTSRIRSRTGRRGSGADVPRSYRTARCCTRAC